MFLKAAEEMDINLASSYMIGDMPKDIQAARSAGVKGILVQTGYEGNVISSGNPVYTAQDILDAVRWIMKDQKSEYPDR
jgi:D-glycero-D-manno-heptose 1,7-bisphosphate phosphatase